MQYVIQTLQKEMRTRIKNRGPNTASQETKLFIRFQSQRKQAQEYFLQTRIQTARNKNHI